MWNLRLTGATQQLVVGLEFELGSDPTVALCCWKDISIRQAASYPQVEPKGHTSFHHPSGVTYSACSLLSLFTNN